MRSHLPALAVVAALMIACFAPSPAARGVTVASNLGPADSFNTSTAWPIQNTALERAMPFTTPGVAYKLDSADVPVTAFVVGNPSLTFELWSNVGNVPGALLASASPLSSLPPIFAPTLSTANFGGTFTLAPNTKYWLVANETTGDQAEWFLNSTGDFGHAARNNNGPFATIAAPNAAFRINGTPAQVVPLPAAAWAGLLLLPMVRLAQRRNKPATQLD